MASFLFETSMRWTGGILDLIAIMVIVATAVFASFSSSDIVSPSLAAMALTSALSVSCFFQCVLPCTVCPAVVLKLHYMLHEVVLQLKMHKLK